MMSTRGPAPITMASLCLLFLLGFVSCSSPRPLSTTVREPRIDSADSPGEASSPSPHDPVVTIAGDGTAEAGQGSFDPEGDPGTVAEASSLDQARIRAKLLMDAYPEAIDAVDFIDGDWAIRMRGTWYWYAEGRFLDAEQRKTPERYARHSWYNYPRDLQPPREPSVEEEVRYRGALAPRTSGPSRSPDFFDRLWGTSSADEAWDNMKSINFLGMRTTVHREIMEELARVELEIIREARKNARVQAFVDSLREVQGYNSRVIAGTANKSMHSYGLAVDLIPRSWGNKWVYWRWSQDNTPWWRVDLNQRYTMPPEVVQAFERHGFTWGGKWLFFDIMHFEYRPEIIVASWGGTQR